jgi:superfamily I DNA/RNA helicase
MADLPTTTRERIHVSTFHTLCETLAERAGLAPPKPPPPAEPQPAYWDKDLPSALAHALDALPEERWHTIVVDEGQDFAPDWLETLQLALSDPSDGVFWVFHDPGQALYHDDQVDQLKLPVVELFEDYRSPRPLAELAAGFYTGPQPPIAMREDGVAPRFVEAATDHDVLEAVRRTLHQLTVEEQVRSWDIVVLSGRSAVHSAVWRQRAFGNLVLWNGAIDDAGRSLRLRADQLPPEPADAAVVRFETVRRFKGLERPVVVLCELPDRPIDDPAKEASWDNLVYTALTRATTQAIVIGSLGRAAPASA